MELRQISRWFPLAGFPFRADVLYIAEMVKIICGTAAPSLKESNGYSRERLLGAAGARQLPMSGFALAALAVRELDQATLEYCAGTICLAEGTVMGGQHTHENVHSGRS